MSLSDLFSNLTGAVSQGINTAVGGPFDFTGSLMNAGQTFDPSQFNPATYGGIYGGTDQYGQTAQEVQSTDPGNQLQGTQQTSTQQNQSQQPQAPQAMQPAPGSLLAAIRQMQSPGANPYAIGGGGAVPSVPPGVLTPNQAVQQRFGAFAPPAAQPAAPAPAAPPQPPPVITAPATPPAPPETPPAATRGARRDTTAPTGPRTGTPDPADEETDPAQQAAQQRAQANVPPQIQQAAQNFLRSPLGQIIDRITNGGLSQLLQPQNLSALQQQYGNQVPYGYTRQNMPPWATPQQYQRYLQTGQMPSQRATGGQGAPIRIPTVREVPNQATPTATAPNVFNTGAQGMQASGAPFFSKDPNKPALPGEANLTGTVDSSKIPQPSPDVQKAIAAGEAAAAPYPTNSIQGRTANVMATSGPGYTDLQGNRRQGMSPNAIAGAFMNVRDESGWNPSQVTPGDQPRYSGEASAAHGLYQEGGPDWPLFQRFLNGRDWRDPNLQTQFMMQHFAQRNPRAWNAMNNARSPGEAAVIMLNNYLIPALPYRQARAARYLRGNQQMAMQ